MCCVRAALTWSSCARTLKISSIKPRRGCPPARTSETMRWRAPRCLPAAGDLSPAGDDYYEVRARTTSYTDSTEHAAFFLYVNRFCFNGVYRTNLRGEFNVPRGDRTGRLPGAHELERAATRLRGKRLLSADFAEVLEGCENGDFVYLDPPYFTRPNITLGEYGYGAMGESGDLSRLADALRQLTERRVKWLLSYSYSRQLIRYVTPLWKRSVLVRRHVGGHSASRSVVREMLLANFVPGKD